MPESVWGVQERRGWVPSHSSAVEGEDGTEPMELTVAVEVALDLLELDEGVRYGLEGRGG